MSALGIDYARLAEAKRRLEQAGELVDTITTAARALDELVTDPDDPVAYALDTAAYLNGNGSAPPTERAELEAGADAQPSSSAAPASSDTMPPPASPPNRSRDDSPQAPAPAPRRGKAVDAVLDYFEAHPREWLGLGDFVRALGLKRTTAQRAIRELAGTETIEDNGRATAGRRYRLDQGLADELERPDDADDEVPNPIDPGADGDDDEQDDAGAGDQPDPIGANGHAGGRNREALERRIRAHLLDEASTISELAFALDVPRRDVAPVVLELAELDPTIVPVVGTYRGRGETVYSNIA